MQMHISKTKHGLSKTKEYGAAREHRRREKKRKLDTQWTVEMEMALRKFQPVCVLCGSDIADATDHALALDNGFGLIPRNAIRLCRSCNGRKWKHTLDKLPPGWKEKILEAAINFLKHWTETHASQ